MTIEEMQQETTNDWMTYHRRAAKTLGIELLPQALAFAKLTRREMDSLKAIGLDEENAWLEARNLYCLAPPPTIEKEHTVD